MTQEDRQGMHLRQSGAPGTQAGAWLSPMLAALVSCAAVILAFAELTGFSSGSAVAVMLAAGGYLCIAYGVTLRFQKQQWFFTAALVILLLLVLLCRRQVQEGYRLFWNQMRNTYTAGTGRVLPKWQTRLPAEKSGQCLTLFAVMTASAAALLCCLLATRAPTVLAVLLPAVFLVGTAAFETDRMAPALIALAGGGLILAYSGWQRRQLASPVWFGWALCAIAAVPLLLASSLPGARSWGENVGRAARQAIHDHRYETEYTTLPEGDFTDYHKPEGGAQPALEVTMTDPQLLYLRGFTGYSLEGDTWSGPDTAVLAKNQELLYWLSRNAFCPAAQFAAAADGLDIGTGYVTVKNVGACSAYRYVPFSLRDTGDLLAENLKTEGLPSDGQRTYGYSVINGSAKQIEQVLSYLQNSDEASVLQYRKAESAYRGFLQRSCLQVPESLIQLLGKYWDEIAADYGSRENLTLPQAQVCALTFLGECFPEEGTPEDMTLPLAGAAGTSFQYATVAAMTLRYYGIPARYAEGYVIPEETAAAAKAGEPIVVDSSCSRGWVEVYQDGIGWIPMELTPGLGEVMEPQPDENQGDGDEQSDNEDPEQEATEQAEEPSPEESTDPQGGTVTRIRKTVLTGVLTALLILLLLLFALILRRRLICRRREEKFHLDDTHEAIAWIFANAVCLLETLGLNRYDGSMRPLCEPARQRFGEDYGLELEESIRLNDRAMFSSRELTEEQRETALKFYADTVKCLQSSVKWYRRLWLKWVRCLY